ncbi:amidohydrolase family protein [Bifidobacterium sp. BRDM6]|uniref:Amidohydrolase family protein n=2 Tax=Bifidobacterium choloepi TaxID=2614131 RepID=A0A6I5MYK7_9BIFI|nr:amidohydrolase family protein [Bifidobacterium choloepi]
MIVDANVYWLPEQLFSDSGVRNHFLRCVPEPYGTRALVKDDGDDKAIVIEKPNGRHNFDYYGRDYDLDRQLADMDEAGVDVAVLKLPGVQEWLDLDLCRQFNDWMAERQEASGGRQVALAVVPPVADDEVLAELGRCHDELGLHGLQVSAHYGERYLDDPMFRPLLHAAADLDMTVYVHQTALPVDYGSLIDYNNVRRSMGRCFDQLTAVSRELFSDLFEELPELRMVHSMLGGGFFAYRTMLLPTDSGNGRFVTDNDRQRQYLERNLFFEMSHAQPWGEGCLELAVHELGADHVIYGSSYPVKKSWLTGGVSTVLRLDVADEAKECMLHRNAESLYRLG